MASQTLIINFQTLRLLTTMLFRSKDSISIKILRNFSGTGGLSIENLESKILSDIVLKQDKEKRYLLTSGLLGWGSVFPEILIRMTI